jgi:hypothetical protein
VVATPKTPGAFISGPFMPREAKGHGELQGEHPSDPTQETSGGITEARELHAKVRL